jgi:uncharacterized protein (DUF2062 family)
MSALLDKYLFAPLRLLLTQGLSPRMLAISLAVGMVVGIFPVLGTTTVLCTIAAAALRLNLVAVQTVHFLMTPVQLLLIIPFVRVGEWILGRTPQPLSISEGLSLIAAGPLNAISVLWDAILHAMLGWVLLGPAVLVALYLILTRVVAATQRKIAAPAAVRGQS